MNETQRLYTPKEVRDMLSLTHSQLHYRASMARCPRRKGEGGYINQLYYTQSDIDAIRCADANINPRPVALPKKTKAKPKRAYNFKKHGTNAS